LVGADRASADEDHREGPDKLRGKFLRLAVHAKVSDAGSRSALVAQALLPVRITPKFDIGAKQSGAQPASSCWSRHQPSRVPPAKPHRQECLCHSNRTEGPDAAPKAAALRLNLRRLRQSTLGYRRAYG
jgi:hypothetical protein